MNYLQITLFFITGLHPHYDSQENSDPPQFLPMSMPNPNSDVSEDVYTCTICQMQFEQWLQFKDHLRVHIDTNSLTCNVCGRIFVNRQNMFAHIQRHAGIGKYQCHICQRTFVQRYHFEGHMTNHFPSQKAVCEFCGKKFSFTSNMKRHRKKCCSFQRHEGFVN